jgi:preprotein translocase subunit SecA
VIYQERQKVLEGEDLGDQIQEIIEDVIPGMINQSSENDRSNDGFEAEDLVALNSELKNFYPMRVDLEELGQRVGIAALTLENVTEAVLNDVKSFYQEREEMIGSENMRGLERQVVLSVLDRKWREHLYDVDYLKEGIGLRAMAQKDPLVEYRSETAYLFNQMNYGIREESLRFLLNIQFRPVESGASGASSQAVVNSNQPAAIGSAQSKPAKSASTNRNNSKSTQQPHTKSPKKSKGFSRQNKKSKKHR